MDYVDVATERIYMATDCYLAPTDARIDVPP